MAAARRRLFLSQYQGQGRLVAKNGLIPWREAACSDEEACSDENSSELRRECIRASSSDENAFESNPTARDHARG